ncbi:hypothetical protein IJ076_00120 [Candidatus Saccharibacteria bacterium]|nr:hypothetical protein [Candidatus Saccharibacteria bacterium]
MAEKLNTQTLNIPDQVVDSDWKDDIDVDYAIYGDNEKQEGEYISPKSVSKESLNQIKDFQVKLAFNGLKKFRKQELEKVVA